MVEQFFLLLTPRPYGHKGSYEVRHRVGRKHDLKSLRILGPAGEPINPEAWMWYFLDTIGEGKLSIVDHVVADGNKWHTHLASSRSHCHQARKRDAPAFRHSAEDIKRGRKRGQTNEGGYLQLKNSWPGMLRGMYNDPENKRMKEVYFSSFPGHYLSGDGARI